MEGSTFLDAYAGTGAVGLEAISRGARDVVFIEHHRAASQLIRQNLAALEIDSGYALLTCAVLTGLERLEREGEHFDVVFLDPPYEEIREYHHTLRQLARGSLLQPSSIVVAEHSSIFNWKRITSPSTAPACCATAMRSWRFTGWLEKMVSSRQ